MYKQNPGDPIKKLDTPSTFSERSTFMKLAKDPSNEMFNTGEDGDAPLNSNHTGDKIKTVELDNVNLTANSPETIRKNVKENRERTTRNTRYVDTPQEQKEVDQGKFSRSKKNVSDQDYRIFKKNQRNNS